MNSISFTPQQVERKLHLKLLEYFDEFNQDNDSRYVEVHIMNDGFCTIIEWEVVPYNHEYGGQFKYVDEEHEVVKQVIFPDNHYEYLPDGEVDEYLNQWKEEHNESENH